MDQNKDFLHRQLIQLGDMMGDGLHHEPDGKWINKEYKRVAQALGYIPKTKRRRAPTDEVDRLMASRTEVVECKKCEGELKQTRSGSMRAKCRNCGAKFQLLKKVSGKK